MDQVKVFLRQLKKHHFWVLSVLTALVGFLCWWSGANTLASATKTNQDLVTKSFNDLQDVDKSAHPANQQFTDGVNSKNEDLKKQVLAEWQKAYDAQQKTFSWPELVAADIAPLKPEEPIPDLYRGRCRSSEVFLKDLHDKVFAMADYRHPKIVPEDAINDPNKAKPAADKREEAPEEVEETMEGLVVWNAAHHKSLVQRYTLMNEPGTPSTLNLRLAQEDIWVLQNLARVIRKTNEGAADVIAVPIKRIDSLDIAQWAINDAVRESPKVYADKTAETGGGGGGLGGGGAGGGGGEALPEGATAAEREKVMDDELLAGRYLADTGLPLGAADAPPYAEFKLMFVRLKVVIDQRKIPDLLVNCANAEVPIEVVRLTMDEPLMSAGNKPNAPAGGAGQGGLRVNQNNAPAARPQGGNAANANNDVEATPADVTVEICGLLQIFNPPDAEKLGTGSAADPGKRPAGVPAAVVKAPRSGGSSGGGGMRGN
ncbi:MAG TPA: hypothetical protein VGN12_25320 [Pirellulales bacterium]|jgi:hypothetical protein